MREILTQCFRGYAVLSVIVAAITASWALGVVAVPLPLVGYAWLLVAAAGTVVAVGITVKKEDAILPDTTAERLEKFERSPVTGRPLEIYMAAVAAWAAVSFGWVLGGMSVEGPALAIGGVSIEGLALVGYGWFAIAVYGIGVGVSLALTHKEEVTTAINPTKSIETDSRRRFE